MIKHMKRFVGARPTKLIWFTGAVALVIFFQNCGHQFESLNEAGDIASNTTSEVQVVSAGPDITLPNSASDISITAEVSASDETINTIQWMQLSGPNSADLGAANSLRVDVSNFVVGTYVFRVLVTYNTGVNIYDDVSVIVEDWGTLPPVTSACVDESLINSTFTQVEGQANKTWAHINSAPGKFPRGTDANGTWVLGGRTFDTSAFYPGVLWLLHKNSPTAGWKKKADFFTNQLQGLKVAESNPYNSADAAYLNIDLGFQYATSFIHKYSVETSVAVRTEIIRAANDLASAYRATIKAIPSRGTDAFTEYDVKIDHLMNLELLLWGAKNGGTSTLRTVAIQHGLTSLAHFIRADGGTFHLVRINKNTGVVTKKHTTQGYADSSTWARGQAWAVYGFTMLFRETSDNRFRDAAMKTADYFLTRLPANQVPPWDFNIPPSVDPNPPKDTSASAIVASALFELSTLVPADKKVFYLAAAKKIMRELSSNQLARRTSDMGILWNAVGHRPNNREVGVSLATADYYFTEALLRWKQDCYKK